MLDRLKVCVNLGKFGGGSDCRGTGEVGSKPERTPTPWGRRSHCRWQSPA